MSSDSPRIDPIADIDAILRPKLFQVIGSTPESLKEACQKCDMAGKTSVASKFISLCIFAASVNKPTVEQFFGEENMRDVRNTISVGFVLNGKVNMTALTLAGHCFMLHPSIQKLEYVEAFGKKMGQKTIWDGDFTSGSISEKQKGILAEKKKVHNAEACSEFATWFLSWSGMILSRPKTRAEYQVSSMTKPTHARGRPSFSIDPMTIEGSSKLLSPSPSRSQVSASANIPEDLADFWLNTLDRTQDDLDAVIEKNGLERVLRNLRKQKEGGAGSVVGTSS